ncbi:MAG TPA: hypothetical protein VIS72_16540 [Anaerolineales bacterium]
MPQKIYPCKLKFLTSINISGSVIRAQTNSMVGFFSHVAETDHEILRAQGTGVSSGNNNIPS